MQKLVFFNKIVSNDLKMSSSAENLSYKMLESIYSF